MTYFKGPYLIYWNIPEYKIHMKKQKQTENTQHHFCKIWEWHLGLF